MNYLSVCSGIEAATVAWHPIGWTPAAFSEIEPFPSAVLAHHYPHVPNVGDMTKYKEWNLDRTVDLLVGGTPCQSFSVAGLRKGLDDPRGNLALVYLGIADCFRPRWIVWENVPGVLSSSSGRDFGSFLGALVELGYGFAYRVLDAQWFGVAQRRRRVFVVGYLGDWRPAAAVLFERESVRRDTAPSRETWKDVTGSTGDGVARCITAGEMKRQDWETCNMVTHPSYGIPGNWIGRQPENGGNAIEPMHDVAPCLTKTDRHGVAQPIAFNARQDPDAWQNRTGPLDTKGSTQAVCITGDVTHTLKAEGFDASEDGTGRGQPIVAAFKGGQGSAAGGIGYSEHVAPTLPASDGGNRTPTLLNAMAVRRLTPMECERLQGFPDGYTAIPWRGKESNDCPDGPRYKALGNSMAVPVMNWIGKRIALVDEVIA